MMSAEYLQQQQARLRRNGPRKPRTKEILPLKTVTVAETMVCSHVKAMKIDGEWYESASCTDPGCPVHGLESVMLATKAYIAEPSREEGPLNMKGRDSR